MLIILYCIGSYLLDDVMTPVPVHSRNEIVFLSVKLSLYVIDVHHGITFSHHHCELSDKNLLPFVSRSGKLCGLA